MSHHEDDETEAKGIEPETGGPQGDTGSEVEPKGAGPQGEDGGGEGGDAPSTVTASPASAAASTSAR